MWYIWIKYHHSTFSKKSTPNFQSSSVLEKLMVFETKSSTFRKENYTHYELEGYEIEGSVLKKCHLNRVASVRFEKFKGCPSTGL